MSKKLESRVLIISVIIFIVFMIINNIQLAMIIARLDKMEMQKIKTDYLITNTYNRII